MAKIANQNMDEEQKALNLWVQWLQKQAKQSNIYE